MRINTLKPTLLAAAVLCAFGSSAYAQSSVTVSGLLETGVRYATNQNAAGDKNIFMADGLINPSRLAFSGSEDLGGGTKAIFKLETGLQLSNGQLIGGSIGDYTDSAATTRLFGREAFVGLEGGFGKITLGRQYTTGYVATWGFDPIYGGGLVTYAPYFGYVGLRQDNMFRYEKSFGAFGLQGHYVAGGKVGDASLGSGVGIGGTYNNGPVGLTAAYQQSNNDVAAAVPSKRKTAVVGGSYNFGPAKATLGYINNSFDGSTQKNDVIVASATYQTSSPWKLTGVAYNDKQRSLDGRHTLLVALADYSLSKRTTLFLEADHHSYSGALIPAASKDTSTGFTAGIRHTF
jgi:predicted porin